MLLSGAKVVLPSEVADPGWVRVAGARITAVGQGYPPVARAGEEHRELAGSFLFPGFIDLHVHGGGGASYMGGEPSQVRRARAFHLAHGTTRSLASLMTAPVDDLLLSLAFLADLTQAGVVAGAHLEGPFLSRAFHGAHDTRHLLSPDVALLERLLRAGRGTVRMVTVAPELPGAIELVRRITSVGVIAAIGHSEATYRAATDAIDAGATVATHLFTEMRPMQYLEPGIAGAALDRPEVACEVIADGHHVHPAMLRVALARAAGRVSLVSDAIAAAGAEDGPYLLGSVWVEAKDGKAFLPRTKAVAGSTITVADAVRYLAVQAGAPLPALAHAASAVPARLLEVDDEVGTIEVGKQADLVVMSPDMEVEAVLVGGQWVPSEEPRPARR